MPRASRNAKKEEKPASPKKEPTPKKETKKEPAKPATPVAEKPITEHAPPSNPTWQRLHRFFQTKRGRNVFNHIDFGYESRQAVLIINNEVYKLRVSHGVSKNKIQEALAQDVCKAHGIGPDSTDEQWEVMFTNMALFPTIVLLYKAAQVNGVKIRFAKEQRKTTTAEGATLEQDHLIMFFNDKEMASHGMKNTDLPALSAARSKCVAQALECEETKGKIIEVVMSEGKVVLSDEEKAALQSGTQDGGNFYYTQDMLENVYGEALVEMPCSHLNGLCQKAKQKVVYADQGVDESNAIQTLYRFSATAGEHTAYGAAPTKKEAKQVAAQALVMFMQKLAPGVVSQAVEVANQPKTANPNSQSPVQILSIVGTLENIKFEAQLSDKIEGAEKHEAFKCDLDFGSFGKITATAASKKGAKTKACEMMLEIVKKAKGRDVSEFIAEESDKRRAAKRKIQQEKFEAKKAKQAEA